AHRPVHFAAANLVDEIGENILAARRVDDLGMELQAVEFFLRLLHHGVGRVVRLADRAEALGQLGDLVAVAVPDVEDVGEIVEEGSRTGEMQQTRAILAMRAVLDFATEVVSHELYAVADAEDGDAELEDR